LRYELEKLESILKEFEEDENKIPQPEISKILKTECERIKVAWRDEVFSSSIEIDIEPHIQRHQVAIIDLKDHILKLLGPVEAEELLKPNMATDSLGALKMIFQSLHDLLTYIEKYFSKYFDLSAKIPDSYRNITARNFSERLPLLTESLKQREIDPNVFKAVTGCFTEFIHNHEEKFDYRAVIYLNELLREIDQLCGSEEKGFEFDRLVCIKMIYLNFNVCSLFNYCVNAMKERYQGKETLDEQLGQLALYQKRINQTQEKPGFSYDPTADSLKVQLGHWVSEEIIFFGRKHQLSFGFKAEPIVPKAPNNKFKVETNLSVSQIAHLIRVMVDTGVITNKNTLEMLRFMADHISSKKTPSIAHESFRRQFYDAKDPAPAVVKNEIIKMLNQSQKYKLKPGAKPSPFDN
jgi:hypothetical protein